MGILLLKTLAIQKLILNPLYFIIDKEDGYIKESNGNKYLTLVSTDKNKDILKKYTELWDKIKNLIRSITNISDYYDEKYMKIKCNLDNSLSLNKILKLYNLTIVVRLVFQKKEMYYPKVSLD